MSVLPFNIKNKNTISNQDKELIGGFLTPNESSTEVNTIQQTSNPTQKPLDFSALAKSSTGSLEIQKYLYDTGLQNVFDDYERNIANLSQQKQQQVQDAYYIREMSKKYLGEYASNNGIGDISGNLLDIFGKYQENIQNINQNYDALKFNLDETLVSEKRNALNNIMQTQFQMEVSKLEQNAQNIVNDISTDNLGGMTPLAYLESKKDTISPNAYAQLYGTIQQSTLNQVQNGLSTGFYGYKKDASGNYITDSKGQKIRISDPLEYVKSFEGQISEAQYKSLLEQVEFGVEHNQAAQVVDYTNPLDETNYLGASFDPLVLAANSEYASDVNKNSSVLSIEGVTYVSSGLSAGNDSYSAEIGVTDSDIRSKVENPTPGQVYNVQGSMWLYKNDKFYHLFKSDVEASSFSKTQIEKQQQWSASNNNFKYNSNGSKNDTVEITIEEDGVSKNIQLEENWHDSKLKFSPTSKELTTKQQALVSLFKQIHPDGSKSGIKQPSMVYYDGMYWYMNKGKITEMVQK